MLAELAGARVPVKLSTLRRWRVAVVADAVREVVREERAAERAVMAAYFQSAMGQYNDKAAQERARRNPQGVS